MECFIKYSYIARNSSAIGLRGLNCCYCTYIYKEYKEASLTLRKMAVILQIEQNEFLRPETGCSKVIDGGS